MSADAVDRLAALGSPALGPAVPTSMIPGPLAPLYSIKNGFYAFESALFVRPVGVGVRSVEWWNGLSWRQVYVDLGAQLTCFAEDVFGFQFAADESGFYSFDPETAEIELVADSVEGWAQAVLEDIDVMVGYSLAREWQERNGGLQQGFRLAPAVPFALGGKFEAAGMRAKPDGELASFRASVYEQTRDLPDGAQVRLRLE
ncbi:hypothetical protein [Micromonospora aurantiaca]|uniref:hypothetical protein n=1 Tax=Micromonospora aurantiaca (nom. illeg.) TaxID=47850 RepID=UPI0037F28BC7